MRLSQMLFVTLRDDPADAEIPSHKLLVRAGFIRRIGSGLYVYLPLMWRVLQKVSQIVREELDRTGAQECLLPQLQPSELWKQSGRWDTYTKSEGIMFALHDRMERELGLGPTHEEVITAIAQDMIRSYRQLPLNLYQIQTKFRDEIRPRFGLMRGREFIMKDAYSFHADQASLKATYQAMDQVYRAILKRCGLAFRAVDADSGAIGGGGSQEFMVLADAGEDEVLYTEDGNYAANVEKANSLPPDAVPSPFAAVERLKTPDCKTIDSLANFVKCDPTCIVKNVLYLAVFDHGKQVLVLVSIRGDQMINEVKLTNTLTGKAPQYDATKLLTLTVAEANTLQKFVQTSIPLGYVGPDLKDDLIVSQPDVAPQFLRLVDKTAQSLTNFVTGANQAEQHGVGVNWGQDVPLPEVVDIRAAQAGDRAVHNPSLTLQTARGIEVGHIFQLGAKYSQSMNATFTNEAGKEVPLEMGCYGIGVSRLAQAAVEQNYDKDGIIWPTAIAPYEVVVVVPNMGDETQVAAAEKLYSDLQTAGVDVLFDDRNERAGVKFKDADLVGIPYRVVTGKSLKNKQLEVVKRASKAAQNLPIDQVVTTLVDWIQQDKIGTAAP